MDASDYGHGHTFTLNSIHLGSPNVRHTRIGAMGLAIARRLLDPWGVFAKLQNQLCLSERNMVREQARLSHLAVTPSKLFKIEGAHALQSGNAVDRPPCARPRWLGVVVSLHRTHVVRGG